MRTLISAIVLLLATLVSLTAAQAQQLTDAQVVATCVQTKALPDNSWTYQFTHTGWADLQWGVQNPFPGRQPGDVRVEITASATPTFSCAPVNAQGQNPQGLPSFPINAPVRGFFVGTDDILACQTINGVSTMVYVFVGQPCPFSAGSGFPAVPQFTGTGPYGSLVAIGGPQCTVYYPSTMLANVRHPIVVWGNGTGSTPATYDALLRYLASYGFVVVAANTTNAGTGREMLACLDFLLEESTRPTSLFLRKLNPYRIATSGHSQGGGGAIMVGRDPRIGAVVPFQPFTRATLFGHEADAASKLNGPMLMLSGALDPTAPPSTDQQPVYNSANAPVFWATEVAGNHSLSTPMARQAMPFLRWQLMQDPQAAAIFTGGCSLCNDPAWAVQKKGF